MALTQEDLDQVTGIVNGTVNGVVATLKKQFDTSRQKDGEAIKGDIAKMLDEKLSKLAPPPPDEGGEGGEGKTGKAGKNKDEASARELLTLKRMVEDLKKSNDEIAATAKQEREKNRAFGLQRSVAAILEGQGITGSRFDAAYAFLQYQGKVRYAADDSDDIVFTDETGEVDYRQGLANWAKSDQAKIYLPPSGTQGSGSRPKTGQPQIKGGPVSPAERNAKIGEALSAWAENSR